MIQRIQSLYLLLALLLLALTMIFPLVSLEESMELYAFSFKSQMESVVHQIDFVPGILLILCSVLAFVSIFLFKNRPVQIRIVRLSLIVSIFTLLFMIFEVFIILRANEEISITSPAIGGIALLIAIILLILANKGIKSDEKLIRSADRLR